ncbi:hypothetical protein ACIQUB_24280 [Rhizobium sp. NPDC090275]|uniref:hypothetical protein n=1 Tax=Rhizobium sp. NPDC090275 TaxID=3364498 RepID=UPI00383A65E6
MTENSAKLGVVSTTLRTETPKLKQQSAADYLANERLRREADADRLRVRRLQAEAQGRQL